MSAMTKIDKTEDAVPKGPYPHVTAAFINVLSEEGTRDELVKYLQEQWNENCALRAFIRQSDRPASGLSEEERRFVTQIKSDIRRPTVIGFPNEDIAALLAIIDRITGRRAEG